MFQGLQKRIAAHTDGLPNTDHVIMDVTINNIFIASQQHYEKLMTEEVCNFERFPGCLFYLLWLSTNRIIGCFI